MGNLRPVLIVGLAFLGYMIWVQWQKDYGPAPQAPAPQAQSGTVRHASSARLTGRTICQRG